MEKGGEGVSTWQWIGAKVAQLCACKTNAMRLAISEMLLIGM